MSATTCPKCHQLYEALESSALNPARRCPRCAAIAELLDAADALNKSVERAIARREGGVLLRAGLLPVSSRAAAAIQKARAQW